MSGPPGWSRESSLDVHVIFNGPLGMSPGKAAAQAFQAAQRLLEAAGKPDAPPGMRERLEAWRREGTCTVARVADTERAFARAAAELDCVVMHDEGVNEVEPGSATCLATWPIRRDCQPRMLRHKRIRLMDGSHSERARAR